MTKIKKIMIGKYGPSSYPYEVSLLLDVKGDKFVELAEGAGFISAGGSFNLKDLLDPKWDSHLSKCGVLWLRELALSKPSMKVQEVLAVYEKGRKEKEERQRNGIHLLNVALRFYQNEEPELACLMFVESAFLVGEFPDLWCFLGLAILELDPEEFPDLVKFAGQAFGSFSLLAEPSHDLFESIRKTHMTVNSEQPLHILGVEDLRERFWEAGEDSIQIHLDKNPENAMGVIMALAGIQRPVSSHFVQCSTRQVGRWCRPCGFKAYRYFWRSIGFT